MMNNEFTIMLIACLCTVTTIVVVMFINTTCAFQEKLDKQEKIIEREKIIHQKREEEQERKFLKKQVEYEQKLERAFDLIEARYSKINEMVLLNKESLDKQQTENMSYCNKMHCQILARQYNECNDECNDNNKELQENINQIKHLYLNDGQRVRHRIPSNNNLWEGTYNALNNSIVCNGTEYKGGKGKNSSCLNNFTTSHYMREAPDRKTKSCNALSDCEKFLNGKWVKVNSSLSI